FDHNNVENIFFTVAPFSGYSFTNAFSVSEEFYRSYQPGDLRKDLYFYEMNNNGSGVVFHYANSYGGSWSTFTGLAIDEVYLNAAEGHARTGNLSKAVELINNLLVTRFANG